MIKILLVLLALLIIITMMFIATKNPQWTFRLAWQPTNTLDPQILQINEKIKINWINYTFALKLPKPAIKYELPLIQTGLQQTGSTHQHWFCRSSITFPELAKQQPLKLVEKDLPTCTSAGVQAWMWLLCKCCCLFLLHCVGCVILSHMELLSPKQVYVSHSLSIINFIFVYLFSKNK